MQGMQHNPAGKTPGECPDRRFTNMNVVLTARWDEPNRLCREDDVVAGLLKGLVLIVIAVLQPVRAALNLVDQFVQNQPDHGTENDKDQQGYHGV